MAGESAAQHCHPLRGVLAETKKENGYVQMHFCKHMAAEMTSQVDVGRTLPDILHISRAKQFAGVSELFRSEAVAVKHSMVPCRSEKYVLLPSYLGR